MSRRKQPSRLPSCSREEVEMSTFKATPPTAMHFSEAYDLIELRVTPSEAEYPRINTELYDDLLRRPDAQAGSPQPVYARLPDDGVHFEVYPDDNVRLDTLELSFDRMDSLNISHPPSDEAVLVTKPRHTVRLRRMAQIGESTID